MRKLLLLLFLCSLTSNALAKVEMWECDLYDNGSHYDFIKIDTDIPQVWIRKEGLWKEYYYDGYVSGQKRIEINTEYNKESNSVLLKDDDGKAIQVFDMLLKQNIYPTGDGLIIDCEEIE
tara:strand:+ start:148 stop:507 length:360 start_codon:yes stop_codon:yes gene_type:complete